LPELGGAPTCTHKQQNKKKKNGSWPMLKVGDGAHQNQNQNKKEKEKRK
jgi:hypothetical protein